jgi:hypothetical protein
MLAYQISKDETDSHKSPKVQIATSIGTGAVWSTSGSPVSNLVAFEGVKSRLRFNEHE